MAGGKLLCNTGGQLRALGCSGGVREGGGVCIHVADSCRCTVETNTALQSNYTPIFFKKAGE